MYFSVSPGTKQSTYFGGRQGGDFVSQQIDVEISDYVAHCKAFVDMERQITAEQKNLFHYFLTGDK